MTGLMIILFFSIFSFFVAYQALKNKHFFWYAPTIAGFKRRKEKSDDGFTIIIGIVMLISGILTLVLFLRGGLDLILS